MMLPISLILANCGMVMALIVVIDFSININSAENRVAPALQDQGLCLSHTPI